MSNRAVREIAVVLILVAAVGLFALDSGGLDIVSRQQVWLAVWWGIALAVAFGFVPRSGLPPGWRLAAAGFVGLVALQLAATTWGPSDDRAVADAARTLGYLGIVALAWLGLGHRSWRLAAGTLILVAISVTLYALVGRLAPDLVGVDTGQLADAGARLFAPLGYWNGLAAWAAASLAMALAWSADGRHGALRGLAAASLPVCMTVVYLTYSRGGVVAAVAGVAIVFGLSRDRRRVLIHGLSGALGGAVCILAVRSQTAIAEGTGTDGALVIVGAIAFASGALYLLASNLTSRSSRSSEATHDHVPRMALLTLAALLVALVAITALAGSNGFGRGADTASLDDSDPAGRLTSVAGSRTDYWSEAIDGFVASPLRGEGPGSFAYRWASEGSEAGLVDDAHSLPFETASELGIAGFLFLTVAIAGLVLIAARGASAAQRNAPATAMCGAGGVLLVSFASDWTWELGGLAHLGLAAAAVVGMAASRPMRSERRLGAPGRVLLTVFAIAAGAIQVPGIVGTEALRETETALAADDPVRAFDRADRALQAAPWSAAARDARARVELALREFDAATSDARRAVDGEPQSASHRITLALAHAGQGRLTDAAAGLAAALELSPNEPRFGSIEVIELGALLDRFSIEVPAPG